MDHFGVLKRAFRITWRSRALWVFGILLALTGAGGGSAGPRFTVPAPDRVTPQSSPFSWQWQRGQEWPYGEWFREPDWAAIDRWFAAPDWGLVAGIVALVLFVILILWVISTILRYVSDNALIRMVDQVETTGSAGTVGQGFRKGWSRPAWRMFLIDLVVGIPFFFAALLLVLLGLSPLLLLGTDSAGVQVLAVVLTIGLELLFIALLVIAGVVVDVLLRLAHREAALANARTFQAVGNAYGLIRRHLKDIGLIWLLMLAVGIGWGLVMIPVVLIVLVLAAAVGGIPAAALYAATQSIGWTIAVGVSLAMLTMIVPLTFLSGLYETFRSSVWTLTYRDVLAMDEVKTLVPAPSEPSA